MLLCRQGFPEKGCGWCRVEGSARFDTSAGRRNSRSLSAYFQGRWNMVSLVWNSSHVRERRLQSTSKAGRETLAHAKDTRVKCSVLSRENLKFRRTPKPWKTVETRLLASLDDLKLHRDRIVSKTGFQMVHPRLFVHDFSIITPVAARRKLVMVWKYPHPIQGWELELPAGHIENGESPEACARRELEEETGYSAGSWKRLGWFHPSPGMSPQKAFVHLARNLKDGSLHREPYEVGMEVKILKVTDAYRQLWRGEIVHSPTASALGIAQPRILEAKRATVSRRS